MHADDLRFRDLPRTDVRFSGSPATSSESRSIRHNLAEPVSPDVDYYDAHITYHLSNRLHTSPLPGRNTDQDQR